MAGSEGPLPAGGRRVLHADVMIGQDERVAARSAHPDQIVVALERRLHAGDR